MTATYNITEDHIGIFENYFPEEMFYLEKIVITK